MPPAGRSLLAFLAGGLLFVGSGCGARDEPVAASPSIRVGLDADSAGLGDPVGLRMSVTLPEGGSIVFPEAGDSLGGWKILRADPVRRIRKGGWERLERRVEIAAYRLGDVGPDTVRLVGLSPAGDSLRFAYAPGRLSVIGQIASGEVDPSRLRDIKDVVRTGPLVWPWLVAGGVVAAAGIAAFLRGLRKRRKKAVASAPLPGPSPEEEFDEAIASLLRSGLLEEGLYREFYYGVSRAVRAYLEKKHALPLLESTSTEVLAILLPRVAGREARQSLRDWLAEGDLVKYARLERLQAEARAYLDRSRRLVQLLAAGAPSDPGGGAP